MKSLLLSRITLVWLLLVGATALSWEVGHGLGFADARSAGAAILVISFVKVRFVIRDFMEIRSAPSWMRAISDAWLVIITAVLVVLFLSAPR